jgi:hypothetical protein
VPKHFILNHPHKKFCLHQHLSRAKTLGCSDKRLSGNERQRARVSYQGVRKPPKRKTTRARSLIRAQLILKLQRHKFCLHQHLSRAKTLGCSDKRLSGNERQRAHVSYQGVRKPPKRKTTRARSLIRAQLILKLQKQKFSLHQHLSGAKTLGCSDKRLSEKDRNSRI